MARNCIAFENLRAEMARSNLTIQDIADALEVSRSTAGNKLSRKRPLLLSEAFTVQRKLFPHTSVIYLFSELKFEAEREGAQPDVSES